MAGASLWSSGDEVAFQWCDRAPYEQFSMDVDSSSESIEALLSKYRGKKTAAGKAADQPPPPPGACRGIGEEGLDEARKLMDGLLQGQGKRAAAATVVRAKAAVLKAKVEQEAKRKEADDKKAKLERKQALHRIPDSRERKESERRNRRKYLALQMERCVSLGGGTEAGIQVLAKMAPCQDKAALDLADANGLFRVGTPTAGTARPAGSGWKCWRGARRSRQPTWHSR